MRHPAACTALSAAIHPDRHGRIPCAPDNCTQPNITHLSLPSLCSPSAARLQPVCSPSAAHLQPLCSRSAAALAAACASVLEEEAEVVFGQLRQRRCISPHLRVDRVDWRGKSDFGAGVTAAPARGRLPWLHLPWLHLPWLHFPRLHLVLLPAHGAPQALIPWLYFTTAVLTMATLTMALLTNYGYTYHGCNY